MTDPRYPIGRYEVPVEPTPESRAVLIQQIADAPRHLRAAVSGLTEAQLETPYREGGWTVRQVVHHLPDSHLNAYTRFKMAATEENPTVKPYAEARWAELPDARTAPIEISLALLQSLHLRWVEFLKSLEPAGFSRSFQNPESGPFSIDRALAMYAWHGRHHVAHVTALKMQKGWATAN